MVLASPCMVTKDSKNSLKITIPKKIAQILNIKYGDLIEVDIKKLDYENTKTTPRKYTKQKKQSQSLSDLEGLQ